MRKRIALVVAGLSFWGSVAFDYLACRLLGGDTYYDAYGYWYDVRVKRERKREAENA